MVNAKTVKYQNNNRVNNLIERSLKFCVKNMAIFRETFFFTIQFIFFQIAKYCFYFLVSNHHTDPNLFFLSKMYFESIRYCFLP